MSGRFVTAITAGIAAGGLLVAGCTSSSGQHSQTSATPPSSAAQRLATTLRSATATLTSAAIALDAGGLVEATTGRLKLRRGQASAADLVIGSGADSTRVIIVGSDAYAELPHGQNTSGKPWITISASSPNEFARGLNGSLQILEAASSPGDLADLVAGAASFTNLGSARIGSTATTGYSFTVTPRASGSALQRQLASLGSGAVPVELYVDDAGRPVKVSLHVTVAGSTTTIGAQLSHFNEPVTITAPPPGEVTSG